MKVVIYARYSSDNQREESIEGQVRVCREYAEKHSMNIVEVYADRAMTGRNTNRPDFLRMMEDAKKQAFTAVLVWKGDRISRDRYDKAACRVKLKKYGISIISVTEAIPEGPEGILLEALLDGLAEYYSANLAQNTLRGMTENALKAKYNGSVVPFGYTVDENKDFQIASQDAVHIVNDVYSRYAAGDAMRDILDCLAAQGVKRNRKSAFNYNTLRGLIANPIYKGTYKFADVVLDDAVPAMVSKELWEAANIRAATSSRKAARPGMSKEMFYLTGKLTCGLCGSPITGASGTSRNGKAYYYYSCLKRKKENDCELQNYPKDELEKRIAIAIESVINDDTIINEIADAYMKAQDRWKTEDSQDRTRIEQRVKELKKELENLTDSLAFDGANKMVVERMKKAQNELDDHEITLAKMAIKQPFLMRSEIVYWLETQKKAIVDNSDEREALNSALLNHCYVYPDKIVIRLNYQDPIAQAQDELSANRNESQETKKATFEVKDGTFPQDVVRLSSDWLPLLDSNRRPFG